MSVNPQSFEFVEGVLSEGMGRVFLIEGYCSSPGGIRFTCHVAAET